LLRAGTGLFAASDFVDAHEFESFVTEIELDKNYPGVEGIGYSVRFAPQDKTQVVAGMHRQGFRDFRIWPDESPRSEYNSIIYLQPQSFRNKGAIGYDMGTNETRRQAMDAARDSGKPVASGRVHLVQEKDLPVASKQSGFLIYVPVYQKNAPINTEQERRDALLGFVYSPLRAKDFIEAVVADKKFDVNFSVYDGAEENAGNLLGSVGNDTSAQPMFTEKKPQEVEGRTWTLAFATNPSFETHSNRYLLKYTLILGGLISLLFAAVTRAEVRARSRAEHSAEELKKSATTIQNTLQQRERAEEALRTTSDALRDADQRALLEYERLLERIKAFAQALGTARELYANLQALREFTNVSDSV
jgi:CHASE1-domain containing sensor protein